jgi:hypothetical protein
MQQNQEIKKKSEKMEVSLPQMAIINRWYKEKGLDNLTPIKFGVYSNNKDSVYYMNFSKLSHLKHSLNIINYTII